MKIQYIFAALAAAAMMSACNADMDIDIAAPVLTAPDESAISGSLQGDDYVLTWAGNGSKMQVTRYANGNKAGSEIVEGNTYTHREVETNVPYMYILKLTDGSNYSKGVIKEYLRPGAGKCSGLSMAQVEKAGGYDAKVTWNANSSATKVNFTADNGGARTISEKLDANVTSYIIPDVKEGETWNVTLVAENNEGTSLPVATSLRIGKLAVAYLSLYDTPEELIANGDDDEAYGWVWFHANYPTGSFVPFSSITSADVLEPYRVAFFMRDIDDPGTVGYDAWTYPEVVNNATPFVAEWYKNGGSLLLWSHATTYIGHLGRLDLDMMKSNDNAIGYGCGNNPDTWKMAVQLAPAGGRFIKDHSTHPIFRGLDVEPAGNTKLIAVKSGSAYTEDHNCLFFNLPSVLTGIGNQEETCYQAATKTYGLYPLGTWDSQIEWVSQLNVWEAQQGNTEYQGTVICVGNGGCNFYLRTQDNFDVLTQPSGNAFQDNIETMAKNAIEYLKTR